MIFSKVALASDKMPASSSDPVLAVMVSETRVVLVRRAAASTQSFPPSMVASTLSDSVKLSSGVTVRMVSPSLSRVTVALMEMPAVTVFPETDRLTFGLLISIEADMPAKL